MKIRKIEKKILKNKVRVTSKIETFGIIKELYFETDIENQEFIEDNIMDSFLLGLFIIAMKNGEDIECENPVSERLKWGLEQYLIPELAKMNKELKVVKIQSPTIIKKIDSTTQNSATGISCGIDSFYAILNNIENVAEESCKIKYCCFYNLYRLYLNEHEAKINFEIDIAIRKKLVKELNLKLLAIDSNLWDFYKQNSFSYIQIHTYFAMSNILCFNCINRYYYASGYTLNEFSMDFSDTAHYDLFLQGFLRTENFEMISEANNISRVEKTLSIIDNRTVQNYLDVCNNKVLANKKNIINCSTCDKCIRTLLTLDIAGKLELVKNIFDIDVFQKNKDKYWCEYFYLGYRTKDVHMLEVIEFAKKTNYNFPKFLCLKILFYMLKLQAKKIIK